MAIIYTLLGVPYVAVIDPVRGVVLQKAARKRIPSPGQMSLFGSNEPKEGDTKVENGVTYRLNRNSRWERTDRAKGKGRAEAKAVVPVIEDKFDLKLASEKEKDKTSSPIVFETLEQANNWFESKGLFSAWELKKSDDFDQALGPEYGITLNTISRVASQFLNMAATYPDHGLTMIGSGYGVAQAKWNLRLEKRIEDDRSSYRGKKWTRNSAIKRVTERDKRSWPEPSINDKKFSQIGNIAEASPTLGFVSMAYMNNSLVNAGDSAQWIEWEESQRSEDRRKWGILTTTAASTEGVFNHEFGHVLDFRYNLSNDKNIQLLYEEASKLPGGIEKQISVYAATNIQEFIAEAFADSFFPTASEMSKKVRHEIDSIIKGYDD